MRLTEEDLKILGVDLTKHSLEEIEDIKNTNVTLCKLMHYEHQHYMRSWPSSESDINAVHYVQPIFDVLLKRNNRLNLIKFFRDKENNKGKGE